MGSLIERKHIQFDELDDYVATHLINYECTKNVQVGDGHFDRVYTNGINTCFIYAFGNGYLIQMTSK